MESYASSSARFREHLQQVATDKPSPNKPAEGLSLVERVRAKDADILHNLVKHVTGGPLILDLPSRSTSGDGADGSDMSDIDSGSSSSDGSTEDEIYTDDEDFDPNKKEEGEEEHRFRRSLVGQGAVVVDQKTMLAHHFFGQRSTDVIVCLSSLLLQLLLIIIIVINKDLDHTDCSIPDENQWCGAYSKNLRSVTTSVGLPKTRGRQNHRMLARSLRLLHSSR